MFRLEHIRESKQISCRSFEHLRSEYAYQCRDDDGLIPWRAFSGEYEINPWSGEIIGLTE